MQDKNVKSIARYKKCKEHSTKPERVFHPRLGINRCMKHPSRTNNVDILSGTINVKYSSRILNVNHPSRTINVNHPSRILNVNHPSRTINVNHPRVDFPPMCLNLFVSGDRFSGDFLLAHIFSTKYF